MNESKPIEAEPVSKEHMDFIESQGKHLFDFVIESRELLHKEALTTMNWLIGIMVGSLTVSVSVLDKWQTSKTWIICGLLVAAMTSAGASVWLLIKALMNTNLSPFGTPPKDLMSADWIDRPIIEVRLAVARRLQEKIDSARTRNHEIGDAINCSRIAIIASAVLAVATALIVKYVLKWS